MANGECSIPSTTCNAFYLQSPAMQQWLLIQLLNALLDSPLTLDQLLTNAQGYVCQSPNAIRQLTADMIVNGLDGVNTAQPVCLTPQELQGEMAYLVCALLAQIA